MWSLGPSGEVDSGVRVSCCVFFGAGAQPDNRLNLGPRIALGEVRYRLKTKGMVW